ncbi:sodium/potassium-transporting ATPase subunit beta-2-like isoform X2 [Lutzomyia longipalpis]|uniref:sodium/potassium-transporting ATPase subunit beta-2-like isoform X2 n=1 Tax=Lutzomyia longipalpis TaxID=7200 RepID=UPI002483394F|nr:sodium/potassium-transporting ATPase subunit beta-2-like isoform X2 [Lutzomyia longipalpis]
MPTDADDSIDAFQQYYRRPVQKSKKESFLKFIYDPKKKSVFGRTGPSWIKIGIFYTVFYGVLAALVAICMWVFFQTLDPRIPKWKMNKSLIGTNPGLGFRPLPPEENVESTLIWYKGTDYENYNVWTEALNEFLAVYKTPGLTPGRGQNIYNCDYQRPPPPGQVCDVEIKSWTPCTQENNYNYHKSSPCVFLKLNKIYGWIPEYYNDSHYLPDGMPQQLKDLVREEEVKTPHTLNTIWVSCEGENPADIENVGPVRYYPRQGFPGYFYPYENSEGYLSPLVAVHFVRPVRGIIINIECKAWAKNIHHDRKERIGSVHFELMID